MPRSRKERRQQILQMQRETWDFLAELIREHIGDPTTGAEIGVYKGETSAALAGMFPDCHLTLVDPWREWEPESSWAKSAYRTGRLTAKQWQKIYAEAKNRMAGTRHTIIRKTSKQAVKDIDDGAFDFTFIDANHTFLEVHRDIRRWLPKTRALLCGHDYGGPYRGVRHAVRKAFGRGNFIGNRRLRIWAKVLK